MKKIILLGKNGQLGSEFVKQNINYNFELYSFGREELDITVPDEVTRTISEIKPDYVINTTAFTNVPDCELKADTAFNVNALCLKSIATECNKHNAKFITFSTDYVFDGKKGSAYLENDRPNPLQIYGLSKYTGELISSLYCRNTYIIRTNGVYGGLKGSRAKKGNFVLNIIERAKENEEINVVSDQIISPTYAADLASATYKLVLNDDIMPGIFHLVNEGFCSWAEFAEKILELTGSKTKIIYTKSSLVTTDFKRPLYTALSNNNAKKYGITLPEWSDALKRYAKVLLNV